jgi:hypothetical protein
MFQTVRDFLPLIHMLYMQRGIRGYRLAGGAWGIRKEVAHFRER